jgi:hypothetical protein
MSASSARVGGGGTSRVCGIVFTSLLPAPCSMTMRWPDASIGTSTSVMVFPSFHRIFMTVVEPKPNGRISVPSSLSAWCFGAGGSTR